MITLSARSGDAANTDLKPRRGEISSPGNETVNT
jgi:hypothetical protein